MAVHDPAPGTGELADALDRALETTGHRSGLVVTAGPGDEVSAWISVGDQGDVTALRAAADSTLSAGPGGAASEARATERLRDALAAGEVEPWFQPLVRLEDGVLTGLEALARWRHPDGTVVPPTEFVPLAERTGLASELDRVVTHAALGWLARWHDVHPDLRLSVNLSGQHLDEPDWLEVLQQAVAASGVPPDRVQLELTESLRPADLAEVATVLGRSRELGFEVWLDDFGTGWSTLQHLLELPIDGLKLDRSLAETIEGRGASVVRAAVQVAVELGLGTVIEGLERPEQADAARRLGCEVGQGYLWSAPVPGDRVAAWLPPGGTLSAPGR